MNQFKRCREMSGYTQKQVAITLKISVQAVSYWETGERMPSYPMLLCLADLYRVSTDELLGRTTPANDGQIAPEERRLLENYRSLNSNGKEYIKQTMYMAVNMDIYKNSDSISSMEAMME